MIEIKQVNKNNFSEASPDSFDRSQTVRKIYRLEDGRLVVFCAFEKENAVGEIMLVPAADKNRIIADSLHVSRGFRRGGIGRRLVEAAKEYAKKQGARAIYTSCCSAKETVDFYLAMGFEPSNDPIRSYAEA